jgi:hypothetical protein
VLEPDLALSDEQHADALVMADVVSQAVLAGIVAAQLDVNVGQALIRLKAYAFGNGRPLAEVAEDVVARNLRFDAHGGKTDA